MQKNSSQVLKILLKSSLLLLLTGCGLLVLSDYSTTLSEVSNLDDKYTVKLSDYENGLEYFDTNAREIPTNPEDIEKIIEELEKIRAAKTDEKSINYLNFRISLFKAENLYKIASRKPFEQYDGIIRCKNKEGILESLNEVREAINLTEEAISYSENLKLDINPEWVVNMRKSNEKLLTYTYNKIDFIEENCIERPPEQS